MPTSIDNARAPKTSLSADALWNVLGSLIYAGCQWGILVATVKLSSAAEVGRLSLGFAITAPIFLLLHLRLRAASATDAGLSFTPASYIALRLVSTALAVVCTVIVCMVSHLPQNTAVIVLWVAAAKAIESGSDLLYGFAQQADDLRSVAVSMTARGILAQVLFTSVLARTHRLDWALAGLCTAWGVVFLFIDMPLDAKRMLRGKAHGDGQTGASSSPSALMRLTLVTLPLGLSTMFMSLMANMPRYFVQHMLGLRALGIFSAAAYLTMTVSVIISAIAEASLAHLARCFAAGDTQQSNAILHRVLGITLLLSAAAVLISFAAGKLLLTLVYQSAYGDAATLLTALMVVAGIANFASVYGYALVAARRFVRYLGALAFSAACTAAACAWMVPQYGTYGAAAACMVGYGVQLACSWLLLRPDLRHATHAQTTENPALAAAAQI